MVDFKKFKKLFVVAHSLTFRLVFAFSIILVFTIFVTAINLSSNLNATKDISSLDKLISKRKFIAEKASWEANKAYQCAVSFKYTKDDYFRLGTIEHLRKSIELITTFIEYKTYEGEIYSPTEDPEMFDFAKRFNESLMTIEESLIEFISLDENQKYVFFATLEPTFENIFELEYDINFLINDITDELFYDLESNSERASLITLVLSVALILVIMIFAFWVCLEIINSVSGILKALDSFSGLDFSFNIPKNVSKKKHEFGKISKAYIIAQKQIISFIKKIITTNDILNELSSQLSDDSIELKLNAESVDEISFNLSQISTSISNHINDLIKFHKKLSKNNSLLSTHMFENLKNISALSNNIQEVKTYIEIQAENNLNTIKIQRKFLDKLSTINDNNHNIESHIVENNRTIDHLFEIAKINENKIDKSSLNIKNISDTFILLKDFTDHIDEIAKEIIKISDQTNLLALNASIQAKSNKNNKEGFVVIANEVKNLSQKTAISINKITKFTDGFTKLVDDSMLKVGTLENNILELNTNVLQSNDLIRTIKNKNDSITEEVSDNQKLLDNANNYSDRFLTNLKNLNNDFEKILHESEKICDTLVITKSISEKSSTSYAETSDCYDEIEISINKIDGDNKFLIDLIPIMVRKSNETYTKSNATSKKSANLQGLSIEMVELLTNFQLPKAIIE